MTSSVRKWYEKGLQRGQRDHYVGGQRGAKRRLRDLRKPCWYSHPEELIVSSYTTCYAMALSNALSDQDTPPEQLTVHAVGLLDGEQLKITHTTSTCGARCSSSRTRGFRTPPRRPSRSTSVPTASGQREGPGQS